MKMIVSRALVVRLVIAILAVVAAVLIWKVWLGRTEAEAPAPDPNAFGLSSAAFEDGQPIPVRYTCDDKDLSPPLTWTNVPEGTVSFALVMDDPDASRMGTFLHWLICDIPVRETGLAEGVRATEVPPSPMGAVQGNNSFRKAGYGGPCPPKGDKPHRYVFKLHALDCTLDIPGAFSTRQLRAAMQGHILAEAQLTGTYKRP